MDNTDIDESAVLPAHMASKFSIKMVDPNLYQGDAQEPDTLMDEDEDVDVDEVASNISADSDALELPRRGRAVRPSTRSLRRPPASRGVRPPLPTTTITPQSRRPRLEIKIPKDHRPQKDSQKLPPDIQFRMSLANEAFLDRIWFCHVGKVQ